MKNATVIILVCCFAATLHAQGHGYYQEGSKKKETYVLVDRARLISDTIKSDQSLRRNLSITFGEILDYPVASSPKWIAVYGDLRNDTLFIRRNQVGSRDKFFAKALLKKKQSPMAKLQLLKIYKEKHDHQKVLQYGLDLIRHNYGRIPTEHESIDSYGEVAYQILMEGYPDQQELGYPELVLQKVRYPSYKARACIDGIRYAIYENDLKKGLSYAKRIINSYLPHMLPGKFEFESHFDSYGIISAQRMIIALSTLLNNQDKDELSDFLYRAIDSEKGKTKSLKAEFCKYLEHPCEDYKWLGPFLMDDDPNSNK